MPARKTPQPEEARKLFLQYPDKKLAEWANEWGITSERVRQIRHESGVGAVYKIDMDVVKYISNQISDGNFTLADRRLYENLPVKYEAFKTWMLKNEEVNKLIQEAQNIAQKQKLNPVEKRCLSCKEVISVDLFKRSQKFVDGRTRVCIPCSETMEVNTKTKRKVCMKCKKEKSYKSFTSNKNFKDGLVPFCKICKSKMRRAKRTLNSKVTDTI